MSRTGVIAAVCAGCLAFAGVAYAASFSLTTTNLGGASVTTPVMFPDSVTIVNGTGAGHNPGRADTGDIVTLVFSEQIDEPTLCAGWSNATSSRTISLKWSISGTGTANDVLAISATPPSPCAAGFHIGSIDLGNAGYNTSATPIDFSSSSSVLTVGASLTTLVITLGSRKNGTQGTVSNGGAATWTPETTVADRAGGTCGNNLAKTSSTTQF